MRKRKWYRRAIGYPDRWIRNHDDGNPEVRLILWAALVVIPLSVLWNLL